MKTRVVFLDTSNRKLLWQKALERALQEPARKPRRWWQAAYEYFEALFA
jgi:hypothetical protein